jgi:hypothetical protein
LKGIVKYGRLNDLKTKMGVDWLRNVGTARKVINHCGDSANFLHDELVKVEAHVSLLGKSFILNFHNGDYDTNFDIALCSDRDVAPPDTQTTQVSVSSLYLAHCDLGSSPEILSVILQSDVNRIILLDNNNIDSLGAVKIAEYLEGNPPIEYISLNCNRLNDDDAILISQALKRNTNLIRLDLERNNFTSVGVKALLTCSFDSSSLNTISESNHTLGRMNIFHEESNKTNGGLQDCIDRLLGLNRMQKIVIALLDKDSLLQYLANIPVELIPEVLVKRGRIVDEYQQEHLNIVYSTMRWWNMPMLYSYHHCVKSDTKRKRDASL